MVTAGVLSRSALGASFSPLSDAADVFLGSTGRQLIALAAALTTAATGNAVLVATSRITFAMARDGLLPRFFARVHPSTKVPWLAVLTNGVILALIALTGAVRLLAAVGSFLYVLQFVFPLVALAVLRHRSKMVPSFRIPAPYLVLPLAFGGCLLLLYASGQGGIGIGLGWLTGGLVTYGGTQGLMIYLRRKRYLKKGYAATMKEIAMLKEQISRVLNEPQVLFEQLLATQARIKELKQLRAIQARIEELEQLRAAQARVGELKQLRATQARMEELELLQATQVCIEEFKFLQATQAHVEEFKFLQALQMRPTKGEGTSFLENALSEPLRKLHAPQDPLPAVQVPTKTDKADLDSTAKRKVIKSRQNDES